MDAELTNFVRGVLFMGYLVAGLFFCRFWRRTREKLFAWFAAAFWLLALERLLMLLMHTAEEHYAAIHAIRLLAFLMIIAAIVNKNRSRGEPS